MKKLFLSAAVFAAVAVAAPQSAEAQRFGAEAAFGSDTDFGIGGRTVVNVSNSVPLDFGGSFLLFFPDGPAEYWEINANLWYPIPTTGGSTVPYVGGGLNIGHQSVSGFSDTELGLNLGGGARFEMANTTPFIEARFVVGGVEQFVIGGGVLFGGP